MTELVDRWVRSMVARFPVLSALLGDHLKDYDGELLPHVFFGDVTRYIISLTIEASRGGLSSARQLHDILDFLEEGFSSDDEQLQELLSVSFLENLPRRGEPGVHIRQMVGPNLSRQLRMIG